MENRGRARREGKEVEPVLQGVRGSEALSYRLTCYGAVAGSGRRAACPGAVALTRRGVVVGDDGSAGPDAKWAGGGAQCRLVILLAFSISILSLPLFSIC